MAAQLLNGFVSLKDVVANRITPDLIPQVNEAYQKSIEEHNRVLAIMLALFVHKTTEFKIRYKSPVAARLQGLDEFGRARKVKAAGYYDVAFPIKSAGIAQGHTRLAKAKMTVQDANDNLALLFDADNRWMRDQILAAMFTRASYSVIDSEHGDLTINGLANGDSTEYLIRAGTEAGESAVDHFKVITAMDNTNAPFADIYRALTKRPENGNGKVITLIPGNLRDEVEALSGFVPFEDEDIKAADNRDVLVGNLDTPLPGEVIGKHSRNWISVWESLPDDYIVSLTTGGDRPLAMREHPESELQGFGAVADRDDDPYYERQFERHAGFAGWNRVGAMVTWMKGSSGSYAPPTGLSQPMS